MSQQARLHLVTVTPGPESALRRQGLSAIADDDVLHRLALWLADVSAEAASAPKAPEASPTPIRVAQGPRVAEPPR
jgi:hypothetical protein